MRAVVVAVAGLLLAAACGADTEASRDRAPVVVPVTIADGKVTPDGERIDVHVGQTVTLSVTSDAADELHVHGEPEAEFEVDEGAQDQQFSYTPTVPGQIAVEAHHVDATVVTLVVTK